VRKLLYILIIFTLAGCTLMPPTQVQPRLEDYVDLNSEEVDIPLTNMPGHELPEKCPIECICPHWFGLSKSPCEPCVKPIVPQKEKTRFYIVQNEAALKSAYNKSGMAILIYDNSYNFNDFTRSIILSLGVLDTMKNSCYGLDEKINVLFTSNVNVYYHAMNKYFDGNWDVGNYIKHPAMLFMKPNFTLPITFEGFNYQEMIDGKICLYAEAFYKASKDIKK